MSGSCTAATAPKGSASFWVDHLNRHHVEHSGIQDRFGQKYIRFRHPSGLLFEIIEDANDTRTGWTTDQISPDVALRGFHGPVLSVQHTTEQERFFVDALGFRKTGTDGPYHRFEVHTGGAATTLVQTSLRPRWCITGAPGSVPLATSPASSWLRTPQGSTANKTVHQMMK